jgi:hypothetical protein
LRRIESTSVPGETRRMLRERMPRFLPVNTTPTGQLQRTVRPLLSDMEVVDLFLNLEIDAGDDIARARALYEQVSRDQLAAEPGISTRL